MISEQQAAEFNALFADFSNREGPQETGVPGLQMIRTGSPGEAMMPVIYNPSLCLILGGQKEVRAGDKVLSYGGGQYIVSSVDLPVSSCVIRASESEPYFCLKMDLDQTILTDLVSSHRADLPERPAPTASGFLIGEADDLFSDAMLRYARLMQMPEDIPTMVPLITREIHYRLLKGAHGSGIAAIATKGSLLQRLSLAVQMLKDEYHKSVSVETLARLSNMSTSSFHYHFKELTGHSPIQYQKRLRLTEARNVMLSEGLTASGAAYRVGYESPAQFSRDYARLFGAPPSKDIKRLQVA